MRKPTKYAQTGRRNMAHKQPSSLETGMHSCKHCERMPAGKAGGSDSLEQYREGYVPSLPELCVAYAITVLEHNRRSLLKDITASDYVGITHQIGNWSLRAEYQQHIDHITNALAILDGSRTSQI